MISRTKKLFSGISFLLAIFLIIPNSTVTSDQTKTESKFPIIRISGESRKNLDEIYGNLALQFEPNRGQTDPRVRFLSRGPGYTLFLTNTGAVLTLKRGAGEKGEHPASMLDESRETEGSKHFSVLRMEPVGARPNPKVEGFDLLAGKSNYFIGKDPIKWKTNISHFAKVRYEDIYPGIDLIFYGNPFNLEHDFVVRPGAKPDSIKLSFEGAEKLEITEQGDLAIHTDGRKVYFQKPKIYQKVKGKEIIVPGGYLLIEPESGTSGRKTQLVGFQVASYDASRPLIIDPVLSYSTYLGGGLGLDATFAIAVDGSGSAYVTGNTSSVDFPTTAGAFDTTFNDTFNPDAFVTKFNTDGTDLVYSTYLGTGSSDAGWGIAVDATGNAYVVGSTGSSNFPTTLGAYDTVEAGGDGFVTKLSPDGSSLVFSTLFGGDDSEDIYGIAVDGSGNAHFVGETESGTINTAGAAVLDNTLGGTRDIFIGRLNSVGTGLTYFTYIGGSSFEDPREGDIALDGAGAVHVIGRTGSADFPTTTGAFDTSFGGTVDIVVVKVMPDGTPLQYSTYLGGSLNEFPGGIALDSGGNIFVTGETSSDDFPKTAGSFDETRNSVDAFVSKINPAGAGTSDLVYSTFLGGSGIDRARDITVGPDDLPNVTGETFSTDFPVTFDALKAAFVNEKDIFVTKVNDDGSDLIFSTVLGGENPVSGQFEFGNAIAVDNLCSIYLTGTASTSDFPTTPGAFQTSTDLGDSFMTKIGDIGCAQIVDITVTISDDPDPVTVGNALTYTVTVTNNGPDDATGVTVTDTLPLIVTYDDAASSPECDETAPNDVECLIGDLPATPGSNSKSVNIVAIPGSSGVITNTVNAFSNETFPALSTDQEQTTIVDVSGSDLGITKVVDDDTPVEGQTVTFTITVTNLGPDNATGVEVEDILPTGLTYLSDTPSQGTYVSGTGLWQVGNMALPSNATLTLQALVDSGTLGNTITNTADITTSNNNPDNDSASVPLTVIGTDVGITKTADKTVAKPGDTVTYTVTVTNNSNVDATGIEVGDALPAGLTYDSDDSQGAYDETSGVWTVGDLAPLETATLTLGATVDTGVPDDTTITNTASITAVTPTDDDPANDSASVDVLVVDAIADLELTISGPSSFPFSQNPVTFSLTTSITNLGPDDATGIEIFDELPSLCKIRPGSPSLGSYDEATGIWTVGDLGVGQKFSLVKDCSETEVGNLVDSARVNTSDQADPESSNNSDDITVRIFEPGGNNGCCSYVKIQSGGSFTDGMGNLIPAFIVILFWLADRMRRGRRMFVPRPA